MNADVASNQSGLKAQMKHAISSAIPADTKWLSLSSGAE